MRLDPLERDWEEEIERNRLDPLERDWEEEIERQRLDPLERWTDRPTG